MATIRPGETWIVALAEKTRDVTVVAETRSPAWWRCADVETGIEFIASERWFLDRAAAEVHLGHVDGVRA